MERDHREGSINALFHGVGERLKICGVAKEKVVGGRDDVSCMILRGLEAFEHQLTYFFRRAFFEAGVLVEAADEEELVADPARGFGEIAVAPHTFRRHGLEAVGAAFGNEFEHGHETAAQVANGLDVQTAEQVVLPLVIGQAKLAEQVGADDGA